jgi:hypothetical protein
MGLFQLPKQAVMDFAKIVVAGNILLGEHTDLYFIKRQYHTVNLLPVICFKGKSKTKQPTR